MAPTIQGSGLAEPPGTLTPVAGDSTPPRPTRLRRAPFGSIVVALVGVAYLGYAVRAGLPAGSAVRAVLVVALTQVLPGALLWRVMRPRHGWWAEDLAIGFAIGSVLAVGAQVLAGLTRWTWLSGGIGVLMAAALLLVPATRNRVVTARTSPLPWWWGSIVAASSLIALPVVQIYFRRVPLDWPSGARVAQADAYHHLALAGQLATRGPTTFPHVKSEPLAYHWFSHGWVAQVSNLSGAELDEVLFRFMPVVVPLAVALSIATAAVRLSGRPWTGPVAAILAIGGGNLNVFGELTPAYPIFPLTPSLGFAAPMLIASVVVLALRWRGELPRGGGVALLVVLCIGAAGTKGSTVPLLVAGLGLAALAMLVFDRARLRPVLVDLGIVVACLLFTFVTIFRGGAAGVHIDPSAAASVTPAARWLGGVQSTAGQVFVLVVTVAAEFTRAVGVFGLLATRRGRRDPTAWLLLGAGVAGAVAVGALKHAGDAQVFFARSAAPLMALGSTLGLVVVIDKLGARARTAVPLGIVAGPVVALAPLAVLGSLRPGGTGHAVAMLSLAVVVLGLVAVVAAVVGSRRPAVIGSVLLVAVLAGGATVVARSLIEFDAPRSAQAVDVSERRAVSRDQIDAARWIRDHSDVDDVVVTNRHCTVPVPQDDCESRRFSVAAYSERQVLVEGWAYTPKSIEIAPEGRQSYTVDYWEPKLLALNDGFIAAPAAAAARELHDRGVRWVFVDDSIPHAATLEPFARLRFQTPGVDVYELRAGS